MELGLYKAVVVHYVERKLGVFSGTCHVYIHVSIARDKLAKTGLGLSIQYKTCGLSVLYFQEIFSFLGKLKCVCFCQFLTIDSQNVLCWTQPSKII